MFISNPNSVQLANIKQMQLDRLAQLNTLPIWSNHDFDVAYFCYLVWSDEDADWVPTREGLCELIINKRVSPDKQKHILEVGRKIANGNDFLSDRMN